MKIYKESIGHYLKWMTEGQKFAFAGYSDAEWYSILGLREGETTGLGQVLSAEHGRRLTDVLKRRQHDPWFLFAVPDCINTLPGFAEGQIDWFLGRNDISIEAYERDRVTDDLARKADLYPLIRQLQTMHVVMIGNHQLEPAFKVLGFAGNFIGVESPNLHMKPKGIEEAALKAFGKKRKDTVFLLSAGVSAAVIADMLFQDNLLRSAGQGPSCWVFDCGSMWDAFVGIGGQRQWRAELYSNPAVLAAWKRQNLQGKRGRLS